MDCRQFMNVCQNKMLPFTLRFSVLLSIFVLYFSFTLLFLKQDLIQSWRDKLYQNVPFPLIISENRQGLNTSFGVSFSFFVVMEGSGLLIFIFMFSFNINNNNLQAGCWSNSRWSDPYYFRGPSTLLLPDPRTNPLLTTEDI